jgi:NAD(P)-dependent dehydrogenase (short-subunit alcohol dehydrogenase family)
VADLHLALREGAAAVSGGGSGIGRSIALGLGAAGLAVAVVDINEANALATAEQIQLQGGRAEHYVSDVSDGASVRRVVSAVGEGLGAPGILINSAGVFPRSTVVEMTEEEWDRVLATNLKSVFLLCRGFLPGMVRQGYGRIVSVTSSLGSTGAAAGAHYAASKAGIDALMRSIAAEVADQGVNVNNVAPGLTDTPMMRGANSDEYIEAVAKRSPRGRLGQPSDVVDLVLFLCSEGAAHITGQVYYLR